ncbi:MAG: CAP domain-containing protein [Methanomicrobiales archaeon]
MKYLKILLIVLVAALAGVAFVAVNSGILADENPALLQHLLTRINTERLSHNLPLVREDAGLADQAERISQETRLSPRAYSSPTEQKTTGITDVFVYPKISWAVYSIGLEPPLFDAWVAEDKDFQQDLLNKGYKNIGIGISSDSYNYYIVTKWQ